MPKNWISCEAQIALLIQRGLHIEDVPAAIAFLSRVGYYRFSGYFRYWQRDPRNGDNRFIEGASFEKVKALYEAEEILVTTLDEVLHPLEVLLRTRFANAYGEIVGSTGVFAHGEGFTQSPLPGAERVEEHALANLDCSKETFVAHYRDEVKQGNQYRPQAYDRMPIWVAVEAFSFGSLSRLIEASGQSGVLDHIANSMNTSRKLLPGQIRSFVYLRNRIAHCARLWNHSVLDVPGLQPNTTRRAKQRYRNFTDHSIYKILIALDDISNRCGLREQWLETSIEPLLATHPLLAQGIAQPAKYGDIPADTLRHAFI